MMRGDSWRDDTLDDESVQEIELDPGMGHLIAGSFSGGAETLCVNAAPAPKPPKPVPGVAQLEPPQSLEAILPSPFIRFLCAFVGAVGHNFCLLSVCRDASPSMGR